MFNVDCTNFRGNDISDTCIYCKYYKNSGVGKFCPNSKCPDKRRSGLTRSDCTQKTQGFMIGFRFSILWVIEFEFQLG